MCSYCIYNSWNEIVINGLSHRHVHEFQILKVTSNYRIGNMYSTYAYGFLVEFSAIRSY